MTNDLLLEHTAVVAALDAALNKCAVPAIRWWWIGRHPAFPQSAPRQSAYGCVLWAPTGVAAVATGPFDDDFQGRIEIAGETIWLTDFLARTSVRAAWLFAAETATTLGSLLADAPDRPAFPLRELSSLGHDPWSISPSPVPEFVLGAGIPGRSAEILEGPSVSAEALAGVEQEAWVAAFRVFDPRTLSVR